MSFSLFQHRVLGTLIGLASLQLGAMAQECPLPDNLDGGPCCEVAYPTLPDFPSFEGSALDLCWLDCQLEQALPCHAEWSRPIPSDPSQCGPFRSKVRLRDSAGGLKWRGKLALTYSRTWLESAGPNGGELQVWRFLVNGDMKPTAQAGDSPCPIPPCVIVHGHARFTGFVDYVYDCQNDQWHFAWMLTHGCDTFDHAQGFPRGGVFHPDRSYTFVGPGSTFVPSPLTPIEAGVSSSEAVRRIRPPVIVPPIVTPPACMYEESVNHVLTPLDQTCPCADSPSQQFMIGDLSLQGDCGTQITSPSSAPLPGFVSMGIGRWVDPLSYPGIEHLRWNAGGYDYLDGCDQKTETEVFFGVSTIGGRPARQLLVTGAGPPLGSVFVDQVNSIRRRKTVMNVPFHSDHILNLNYD